MPYSDEQGQNNLQSDQDGDDKITILDMYGDI